MSLRFTTSEDALLKSAADALHEAIKDYKNKRGIKFLR